MKKEIVEKMIELANKNYNMAVEKYIEGNYEESHIYHQEMLAIKEILASVSELAIREED